MVTEVVARGAFDGIERRANRVRVNRDHDETRTVGRAVAFHPAPRRRAASPRSGSPRPRSATRRSTLADDDVPRRVAPGSCRSMPRPADDAVGDRDRAAGSPRLLLDHIALTPDPRLRRTPRCSPSAHADAAAPQARTATPNLDRCVRCASTEPRDAR